MIKKVSLALTALGLSVSAFAAHPVDDMLPAAPPTVNVTIPQQLGSWSVGIEALYQQPGNADFHYATSGNFATVNTATSTVIDANARVHTVSPNYSWGWKIDVAYLFPGNGRDVQLAWTHLHANDSSSQSSPNGNNGFLAGPSIFSPAFFFANGWDNASGSSRNDYDAVDLVFGQKMDFGQKVTLRAFGGLRYADIDTRDRSSYFAAFDNGIAGIDTLDVNLALKSEFKGVGPRAGLDAKVRLGSGFSLVGTFAGSLLIGDLDHRAYANFTFFDAGLIFDTVATGDFNAKVSSDTRVVPELDARIGLNYTYAYNPDTAFGIEIGWEAVNYFNVKDHALGSYIDTVSNESNFSLQGPYLRVQLDLA